MTANRLMRFFLMLSCFMLLPCHALAELKVQEVTTGDIEAWLVTDTHVPVIEVRLVFEGAGYASDPETMQGRAAFAATMLTEGAGTRDATAFAEALESDAISINVDTQRDHVMISMRSLSANQNRAFELLGDMLLRPQMDEQALARLKQKIVAKRQQHQESPYYQASRAFDVHAFEGHGYANDKWGDAAVTDAFTPDGLRHYINTHLSAENVHIAVVGAITSRQLKRLLEQYLSALPKAFQPKRKLTPIALQVAEPLHVHMDKPQTLLLFASEGISRDDERFYAAYVLNHILGGRTLTSKLGEELRKKRGLTYGVSTDLDNQLYADLWQGYIATSNDTVQEAVEAIKLVLSDLAKKGVTQQERDEAIQYITGSFPLRVDSNSGIASYLTSMQLYDLGSDYMAKRNHYFEQVSLEQINRIATEWLQPERWQWAMAGGFKAEDANTDAE